MIATVDWAQPWLTHLKAPGKAVEPHHECERAQSEAATGELFVRHWMHVAMVYMNGTKMSKSLGNLEFVDRLRKAHDPRAIRLALIANHYRLEWEWDASAMPRAHERLAKWSQASQGDGNAGLADVRSALDDDLNVPAALAVIDLVAEAGQRVDVAANLLGINIETRI